MLSRPALKRIYSIAGRVFSIHTFDDWSNEAASKLVAGWFMRPLENGHGPPDATLNISTGPVLPDIPTDLSKFSISEAGTCHTDQKTFFLEFDGSLIRTDSSSEVTVWISRPENLDSITLSRVLSQAFSAALRRCGLYDIHSGAVVPPDETGAVLIAGPSGSGKSTLTAKLAAAGWAYLTDDTLILRNDAAGVEAVALRQFFALTAATVAAFPDMQTKPLPDSRKARFTPQEFFSGHQIEAAKPSVVLFSTITREPATRLVRLSQSEAMSRLLKLCPWACYDANSASDHLTVLGRLARETAGFDILAGTDVLHDPRLASDLIYQAYSRD
ncbi:MAG TPA: hypothetical protein VLA93_05130 [Pyrinomonadaceae bacterium]|nr:hypothetical protein [Pyrinomonadaceae bacterium]